MIRDGMRRRIQHLREQRQKEIARRERLLGLEGRWQHYPLPVQASLQLHADLYGLDAAEHVITILERFTQATEERPD